MLSFFFKSSKTDYFFYNGYNVGVFIIGDVSVIKMFGYTPLIYYALYGEWIGLNFIFPWVLAIFN